MNRIKEPNQWVESTNRIYESNKCIESMIRINESNLWIESKSQGKESNLWIESMNDLGWSCFTNQYFWPLRGIHESIPWIASMKGIFQSIQWIEWWNEDRCKHKNERYEHEYEHWQTPLSQHCQPVGPHRMPILPDAPYSSSGVGTCGAAMLKNHCGNGSLQASQASSSASLCGRPTSNR